MKTQESTIEQAFVAKFKKQGFGLYKTKDLKSKFTKFKKETETIHRLIHDISFELEKGNITVCNKKLKKADKIIEKLILII